VAYAVIVWALTLLLVPVAGLGLLYALAALLLGAVFVGLSVALLRSGSATVAMRLFTYSITYVTLLFAAMALDVLVRNGL
jgi:protoheme IX farnesyltransferase